MRPTSRLLLPRLGVGAVVVAVFGLGAQPSWARTDADGSLRLAGVRLAGSSYPFAGYISAPTTITSATASVTVPPFVCTKKTMAVTAEATVYDSNGPYFSSAMVYLGCSSKRETVVALAQVDNTYSTPSVTLSPGDTVLLSATCGASGVSLTIEDVTTSATGSASSSTPETCTQAEVGDGAVLNAKGSGLVAIPPFGTLTFSDAMFNGAAVGTFSTTTADYHEGKRNVITTGSLTTGGTTFTTTQGG